MYEWENEISKTAIERNKDYHRKEIKRISEVTLRGNFSNPDDREYWVAKLKEHNGKLRYFEAEYK